MQRFENELPKSVLKLIIKEIDKEVSESDISWTKDDVYERDILEIIDSSIKKFGITNIDWESYGFFWKLYQDNHNFDGEGDIVVPKMMVFPVDISVNVIKYVTESYLHNIHTYDKEYVNSFIYEGPEGFDYYEGAYRGEDVYDSETNDWQIEEIGGPISLKEGKKVRRVITESDNKELQDLLIMQKAIEERIKYLSS
jgi:hypothetical protein